MKQKKRYMSLILCASLCFASVPIHRTFAKTGRPTLTSKASILFGKQAYLSISKNGTSIKKISWESSNKKIVTVKKSGTYKAKIKGAKVGTTTVTATISYKYKKKSHTLVLVCPVTVRENPALTTASPGAITATQVPVPTLEPVPATWAPPTPSPTAEPTYILFTADPTEEPTPEPTTTPFDGGTWPPTASPTPTVVPSATPTLTPKP